MHNTKLNTNKSKKSNPENLKPKKLALDPHQHKIKHEQIWKIKPPHHQSIKHKTQTQNFWPPNTKTLNSTPIILGTKENRRKERVWFSYLSEKPTQINLNQHKTQPSETQRLTTHRFETQRSTTHRFETHQSETQLKPLIRNLQTHQVHHL